MKKILALLLPSLLCTGLLVAGSQLSCAEPEKYNTGIDSVENTWVLIPVLPSDTATGILPTLTLNFTQKKFTGSTGCNQMSGSFFVSQNAIKFSSDFTMTKMLCEGYNEKVFIENLLRVNSFRIEDGMLILMDGHTPLSKWKSKKADNII